MLRKSIFIAGAAIAAISSAAFASVTYDPATGTGFVGKGDVQYTYGWNNAQLQSNATGVTFSYVAETSYDAVCEWDTVTGGKESKTIHHVVTRTKSSSVIATLNGDPRQTKGQKQFTGFILSGFGAVIETGDTLPVVGDICVGDKGDNSTADGRYTSVTPSEDNQPGALYVSSNGDTRLLVSPPTI